MYKNRGLTDPPLKRFKGVLFIFGPVPFVILLEKIMQWFGDIREVGNPTSVEVDETDKFADTSNHSGGLPIHDVRNLFIVHFETLSTNVYPEEFDLLLVKFTFLRVTEELCLSQAQQSVTNALDMFFFGFVVIQRVIEIVFQVLV